MCMHAFSSMSVKEASVGCVGVRRTFSFSFTFHFLSVHIAVPTVASASEMAFIE